MSNITPVVTSGIDTKETSTRQVPKQDFSKVLKESLSITTRTIANGVAIMSPELDVSKTLVSTVSRGLMEKTTEIPNRDSITGERANQGGDGTIDHLSNQSASTSDLLSATKALQEANWQFSLEYLNLQERVQSENRYFSTVSNIMRTRHDSAKNAINNLR
jgi:hypothetical protein